VPPGGSRSDAAGAVFGVAQVSQMDREPGSRLRSWGFLAPPARLPDGERPRGRRPGRRATDRPSDVCNYAHTTTRRGVEWRRAAYRYGDPLPVILAKPATPGPTRPTSDTRATTKTGGPVEHATPPPGPPSTPRPRCTWRQQRDNGHMPQHETADHAAPQKSRYRPLRRRLSRDACPQLVPAIADTRPTTAARPRGRRPYSRRPGDPGVRLERRGWRCRHPHTR